MAEREACRHDLGRPASHAFRSAKLDRPAGSTARLLLIPLAAASFGCRAPGRFAVEELTLPSPLFVPAAVTPELSETGIVLALFEEDEDSEPPD